MIKEKESFFIFWIYVGLAIITFALYFKIGNFDFVTYDDNNYVTENRHVLTGLTVENIKWAFSSAHFFMWHPVTSLSHMFDCQFFNLNAGYHHLVSLAIHVANVLLLFFILKKMTGRIWPSALAALFFAIHPLNVESVAWIAERKTVLSCFFSFLTIAAYINYCNKPKFFNYFLILLALSFALMSKPSAVTVPFVLLLLDFWPLKRIQEGLFDLIIEKIPLLFLSAAVCIITIIAQKGGDVLNEQLPLYMRFANAFVSYITYISKMFYPVNLAVFYPHPGFTLPLWKSFISLLILIIISIGIFRNYRSRPYMITGWLWFLGTLIPMIGLVQAGTQALADRYAYFSLIGLFIIIIWCFADLIERFKNFNKLYATAVFIFIFFLSTATWLQINYWANGRTLFEHALKATKNNYVAHYSLGYHLFEDGKRDEAISHFYEALKINPSYELAHTSLGIAFFQKGQFDKAAEHLLLAIASKPHFPESYYNLAFVLASQGKNDEALTYYHKTIEIDPEYFLAYNNIGNIYFSKNDLKQAKYFYLKALDVTSDYAEAYNNIGTVFLAENKFDEAVKNFQKSLQLRDDIPDTYLNLSLALSQKGQKEDAIKYAEKALILTQSSGNQQSSKNIQGFINSLRNK